jgi:hypothetical protein
MNDVMISFVVESSTREASDLLSEGESRALPSLIPDNRFSRLLTLLTLRTFELSRRCNNTPTTTSMAPQARLPQVEPPELFSHVTYSVLRDLAGTEDTNWGTALAKLESPFVVPPKPFPFLSLPLELRHAIYAQVFSIPSNPSVSDAVALRLTCRTILSEIDDELARQYASPCRMPAHTHSPGPSPACVHRSVSRSRCPPCLISNSMTGAKAYS